LVEIGIDAGEDAVQFGHDGQSFQPPTHDRTAANRAASGLAAAPAGIFPRLSRLVIMTPVISASKLGADHRRHARPAL
jgi:hypothetical protein